jgi:hypothetical protein
MTDLTPRQILDAIRDALKESDRIAKERPDGTAATFELKQPRRFSNEYWPRLDEILYEFDKDLIGPVRRQAKSPEQSLGDKMLLPSPES